MENANFLTQIVFDQVTFGVLVFQSLSEGQIFRADGQTNGVVFVFHLLFRQRVHPTVALLFTHRHPPTIDTTPPTGETINEDLMLMLLLMMILTLTSQSEFTARFERVTRLVSVSLGRIRHSGCGWFFVNGRHWRPIHFKRTSGTHWEITKSNNSFLYLLCCCCCLAKKMKKKKTRRISYHTYTYVRTRPNSTLDWAPFSPVRATYRLVIRFTVFNTVARTDDVYLQVFPPFFSVFLFSSSCLFVKKKSDYFFFLICFFSFSIFSTFFS